MKKAIIIIPYFGNFPNFFQLFLNSCEKNKSFTWLIYTDNKEDYNYPANVIVKEVEFINFVDFIQAKFDFKIEIIRPHKLCDFKVAYGYIFENEIRDYKYWGHGDLDLIYGNLGKFIDPLMLEGYDKIYSLGHLSLYKNSYENNRVFMDKLVAMKPYRKIFATDKAYAFDEWHCPLGSINELFKNRKSKFFEINHCANLSSGSSSFQLSNYIINFQNYSIDKNFNNIFSLSDNVLLRYSYIHKKMKVIEYPYLHFHKRDMKIQCKNFNEFMMVPNAFIEYHKSVDIDYILNYSHKKIINVQFFKKKIINIKYRMNQFLR